MVPRTRSLTLVRMIALLLAFMGILVSPHCKHTLINVADVGSEHADISTLGGAGFASQAYDKPISLHMSQFKGISFVTTPPSSSEKVCATDYVLTLKTAQPERRPDGRLQSRLSFEFPFSSSEPGEKVATWADFQPTYRGRPAKGRLDPANITEVGWMCRSNFGQQEGRFEVGLTQVKALREDRGWTSWDWWVSWVKRMVMAWTTMWVWDSGVQLK